MGIQLGVPVIHDQVALELGEDGLKFANKNIHFLILRVEEIDFFDIVVNSLKIFSLIVLLISYDLVDIFWFDKFLDLRRT